MKKRLLPPVFKLIGLSVIIIPLILLLLARAFNIGFIRNIITQNKELFWQIGRSVFLTGFLLILLSREKIEDEFADFCRLTAFRLTFLFGIISVILNPIHFFHSNNNLDNSSHLLFIQCIFYLIIFYATKKGLIRYEK